MAKQTSQKHTSHDVAKAVSLFFAVRGVIRTKLAKGRRLDPTTWLRIETMKFIADHDKPKMKDIAEYLSITAPSATSLVGGLVKSGFVAHAADSRDKRTSRLTLTLKGSAELKRALVRGGKILGTVFETLSKKELIAFTHALEQIQTHAPR
jgi:DNA-binding MarR family transcriptional regulator